MCSCALLISFGALLLCVVKICCCALRSYFGTLFPFAFATPLLAPLLFPTETRFCPFLFAPAKKVACTTRLFLASVVRVCFVTSPPPTCLAPARSVTQR